MQTDIASYVAIAIENHEALQESIAAWNDSRV